MSHPSSGPELSVGGTERLKAALGHAAHLLPVQGPIGVFIHHNTLHAFQHLRFEEAVVEASKVFGTEPFMTEPAFRDQIAAGRIRETDIEEILREEPDLEIWAGRLSSRQLRRAMLLPGLRTFTRENIAWQIEERQLLRQFRPDVARSEQESTPEAAHALFVACFRRLPRLPLVEDPLPVRPRDGVLAWTGTDTDSAVHPWLIRWSAAFVDQGISYWPMPGRELGFYHAIREMILLPGFVEPELLSGVRRQFEQHVGSSAEEVVLRYLERCAEPEHWDSLLAAELLALPGWAGLFFRLEEEPQLAPYEVVPCRLLDFLAVRFLLTQAALESAWRQANGAQTDPLPDDVWLHWRRLPPQPEGSRPNTRELDEMVVAARVFDVAQLLGLSAREVDQFGSAEFDAWVREIARFDDLERRRVLHLAYERFHEKSILNPLRRHRSERDPRKPRPRPAAQVMFCIDEREESIRRALEEADPDVETLGAAGFFGVAVNYRGLDDAHGAAYCPVVVSPQHAVVEVAHENERSLWERRRNRRRLWASVSRGVWIGSRTLVRGWIGTIGFGVISLAPLVTRVLSPRTASQVQRWLSERMLPEPRTELTLMRQDPSGHHVAEGLLLGFSVEEKADRVAGVLRPAGLTTGFSRMVVILGHGSTSLNNPHESAHDCGACGGRRGGPNARLFAAMANHPEVRAVLRERGLVIPDDIWFVGGYHDTCNDDVLLFDTELIPASHTADFQRIRASLDQARAGNALERARRFEAAWRDTTPERALRHVQERSEHLSEPRPEYGHATNAVAVVGRRAITEGLFMDRRSFLISYDPDQDPKNDSLAALLGAAGPVCAGINLEYYFSFVDNERYGCGTKLPHNVTGLMGVMNGHASDLRTGLPWQMVEVHEPVRLLLVVETSPERLMDAVKRSPLVTELVENQWIRIATIDPGDGTVHVLRHNRFVELTDPVPPLPRVESSPAWFLGHLDHLPLAQIGSPTREAPLATECL